ncbi:MAG: DHH family phosphoesterase [Candidatus Hydrothermarchaeota archaeon]
MKYAVLGCGTVGYIVASSLQERGGEVFVIDHDETRVEALKERGLNVYHCDMCDPELLKREEIQNAEVILILTGDENLNHKVLKAIRKKNPEAYTIVRATEVASREEFLKSGADTVIYPKDVIAQAIIDKLKEAGLGRKLKKLGKIISGANEKGVLIVLQDNPDPDGISSAYGLRRIVEYYDKRADIAYGGEIGHQENKALVNLLGVDMIHMPEIDLKEYQVIAMVDCSIPGSNNSLPKKTKVDIVIDHHPVEPSNVEASYIDLRPSIGATASIITEYLRYKKISIDSELATALLHGIKTDTQGFKRGTDPLDLEAFMFLYPLADQEQLRRIETPDLSGETLEVLGEAIKNKKVKGSILISNVGIIRNRDALPQAADFLLNLEGISTVLVFGIVEGEAHISGRSRDVRVHMGQTLNAAFGSSGSAGGHATAGAAKIPLGLFGNVKDKTTLLKLVDEAITKRFYEVVGVKEE